MAERASEEGCLNGGGLAAENSDRRMERQPSRDAAKLEDAASIMSQDNLISIVSGVGDMYELAELVATQVASGLEVPDNSSAGPQGGNGDDLTITVDPPAERASVPTAMSPALLPRALLTVALLTLIIDMGTVFYKPPKGVVFGHHKLAYYLALAGIFAAGVAEAMSAFWISRSHDVSGRRFPLGRVVLCASIVPFVVIVAIAGFAFIDG